MKHLSLAAVGLILCPLPVLAELTHADPDKLAALISGEGYPVEQTTDSVGDPQLQVKTEGTTFYVQFYGCSDAHLDCQSIQFLVGFDMADGLDAETALGWARTQRYTSVYLDDDRDPFLQMDVNIEGGISEDNLRDTVEIWRTSLSEFKDQIDW